MTKHGAKLPTSSFLMTAVCQSRLYLALRPTSYVHRMTFIHSYFGIVTRRPLSFIASFSDSTARLKAYVSASLQMVNPIMAERQVTCTAKNDIKSVNVEFPFLLVGYMLPVSEAGHELQNVRCERSLWFACVLNSSSVQFM